MAEDQSKKSPDSTDAGKRKPFDEAPKQKPIHEDIHSGRRKQGNDSTTPPDPPEERGIRKGGA